MLICLLGVWFLHKRKKRRTTAKNGIPQLVTSAARRNPFDDSTHDGFLPPLLYSGSSFAEEDLFLPTYWENQSDVSREEPSSPIHSHTSKRASTETVWPGPVRELGEGRAPDMSVLAPDAVGIALSTGERADDSPDRISREIQLVAPVPVRPMVHRNSLERIARQGVRTDSVVSESLSSMRWMAQARENRLNGASNSSGGTLSSIRSLGISVISDGELEEILSRA